MASEYEFIDPSLDRVIEKVKQENNSDPMIHEPYNIKTFRNDIESGKWEELHFDDNKNLSDSEVNTLCEVIEEFQVTPFMISVMMRFSRTTFDEFLSRLQYVARYIIYKEKLDAENPKIIKKKKILFITKKSEKRTKPTKKVYIKYQDPNKDEKKKEDNNTSFSDSSSIPFYDPILVFGHLACIDHNNSGSSWNCDNNETGGGCESGDGGGSSSWCDSGSGFDSGGGGGGGCDSGGGGGDGGGGDGGD